MSKILAKEENNKTLKEDTIMKRRVLTVEEFNKKVEEYAERYRKISDEIDYYVLEEHTFYTIERNVDGCAIPTIVERISPVEICVDLDELLVQASYRANRDDRADRADWDDRDKEDLPQEVRSTDFDDFGLVTCRRTLLPGKCVMGPGVQRVDVIVPVKKLDK